MDEVAVVKTKTFLNVSSTPKTASKFQWKRKKWVEMCACTGGFYMAQCADKFLLRPDCADNCQCMTEGGCTVASMHPAVE